ncbi:hypothetical protein Y1Q_0004618 [Alligator mississippiensis]|uniref:Uncharacterized protein n=1 Tax=Alligator mississippiensis TaxID=8496 RepID=A0A151MHS3_ALLMI|nr:hypothetical protein Y1Q_0004618 [Alligator mississippiensis]
MAPCLIRAPPSAKNQAAESGRRVGVKDMDGQGPLAGCDLLRPVCGRGTTTAWQCSSLQGAAGNRVQGAPRTPAHGQETASQCEEQLSAGIGTPTQNTLKEA